MNSLLSHYDTSLLTRSYFLYLSFKNASFEYARDVFFCRAALWGIVLKFARFCCEVRDSNEQQTFIFRKIKFDLPLINCFCFTFVYRHGLVDA